jgi:proteic killer suppression protein
MKVKFKTNELEYFYLTPLIEIRGKLSVQRDIIEQFKKKIQILISIESLNELEKFKSLNFEKLKGDRIGEYSIRLNIHYRLIFEIVEEVDDKFVIEVIMISEISKHYGK